MLDRLIARVRRLPWRARAELRSARYSSRLPPHGAPAGTRAFAATRTEALAILTRLEAEESLPANRGLVERYTSDYWQEERHRVRRYVATGLDPSFRREPALAHSILSIWPRAPLDDEYHAYLFSIDDACARSLRDAPVESRIGRPYLEFVPPRLLASLDTVRHLYYLARVLRLTTGALPDSVLEIGGGFGNLARLVKRLAPGATYVDVDHPEVLALAYLNLRLSLPNQAIVVHDRSPVEAREGAINLVPLWLAGELRFEPDLLVSTLGLSEAAAEMRGLVASRAFFGCRRLYLLGSRDPVFRSDGDIVASVEGLFGPGCVRDSIKPNCYEVAAMRR
jgi:putative sugar O-methyltransferase